MTSLRDIIEVQYFEKFSKKKVQVSSFEILIYCFYYMMFLGRILLKKRYFQI